MVIGGIALAGPSKGNTFCFHLRVMFQKGQVGVSKPDVWMYVDFDRSEGHLGAKIGPKSVLGAILGAKIGPKSDLGSILGAKMGPRSTQKRPRTEPGGTKTEISIAKTIRDPPGEIFPAMVGRLGAVLEPKIDQNGSKNPQKKGSNK